VSVPRQESRLSCILDFRIVPTVEYFYLFTSATCGIQHTAERQRHIQIIAVMYQLFRLVFMQLPKLCQRIYVVFDMKYHMIYVITWIPVIMWALVCIWYIMLPMSLDCPFMIALSVFSNVYLCNVTYKWQSS
jgi:hypothetical protein